MSETIYWTNKKGEKVHPDMVRADDKIKHELVIGIMKKVHERRDTLASFKHEIVEDIDTYMELLRSEYNLDVMKDSKLGNITLQSFDGLVKVQVAVSQHIDFDEKLGLAKEKIDQFLKAETKDASPVLKTLVMKVFEVDKKGNINAKQVLALKSYDISEPLWLEAMSIIDDAVEIVGSKSYIRFYERNSVEDKWKNLSLNFSDME
jgi:hypothetical protein